MSSYEAKEILRIIENFPSKLNYVISFLSKDIKRYWIIIYLSKKSVHHKEIVTSLISLRRLDIILSDSEMYFMKIDESQKILKYIDGDRICDALASTKNIPPGVAVMCKELIVMLIVLRVKLWEIFEVAKAIVNRPGDLETLFKIYKFDANIRSTEGENLLQYCTNGESRKILLENGFHSVNNKKYKKDGSWRHDPYHQTMMVEN